eukprot:657246_1
MTMITSTTLLRMISKQLYETHPHQRHKCHRIPIPLIITPHNVIPGANHHYITTCNPNTAQFNGTSTPCRVPFITSGNANPWAVPFKSTNPCAIQSETSNPCAVPFNTANEQIRDVQNDDPFIPQHKILSALENTLQNVKGQLTKWKYADAPRREIGQYCRRILDVCRSLLNILSGDNICGESELLKLNRIESIFDGIKTYLNNEECVQSKVLQIVSPHIGYNALKEFGIGISRSLYDSTRDSYKKNGIKLDGYTKHETRGRPSKLNDPLIRKDVYDHAWAYSDYHHEKVLKRLSKTYMINIKRMVMQYYLMMIQMKDMKMNRI